MRWILVLLLAWPAYAWSAEPIIGTARVIDGDTLAMNGTRIRLWGIDAPEMHHHRGPRSKAFLARLIERKRVTCRPRYRDRYRRVVAMCFIGRRDVARIMVRSGHARDWPKYSKGYYR